MNDPAPWRGRWLLYAAGAAMLFVGLRGIVEDANGWTNPPYWLGLFLAGAVVHDLVLAPAVFLAAVLLARAVPTAARPVVAAGTIVSAVLVLLAWPGLRGYGRDEGNPSILPLDYGAGLLLALAAIWGGIALYGLGRALRAGRRGHGL